MKRTGIWWLPIALVLTQAAAADGVLEINQLCVATGCFEGDDPGWPVEIMEAGSYRLTSNLIVDNLPSPIDGVQILTSNVSLDLAGFAVRGPVICTGNGPTCLSFPGNPQYGIVAIIQPGPFLRNVKVFNGSVQGFDLDCINLPVRNFELSDLRVSDCGASGIRTSLSGRINEVDVSECGGPGAVVTSASRVSNSTFYNNGGPGVRLGICESNLFADNGDAAAAPEESCSVDVANNICSASVCP